MHQTITQLAQSTGFDLVRFTSATLNGDAFGRYEQWVTAGRAGEMAYMSRDPERRRGAHAILPEAKTVICLGVNYYRPHRERSRQAMDEGVATGQVARYAYGRDYHKVIEKMLKELVGALQKAYPDHQWKTYVDTGAVLERAYAEQAGLGYIGKNTNLITPEFGSWVFLSEVITDLTLPGEAYSANGRMTDSCGHCRLCLDICPTGALVAANELDARLCISYLTIENRGPIPVELRPLIGDWLYGCDLCQEICPKNVRAKASNNEDLTAIRIGGDIQSLVDILNLRTKEQFDERFAGSAMRRTKREGLVRNACVVAGNVRAAELLPLLKTLAEEDDSALVREHAKWAVEQF